MKLKESGFTLIELIISVAIMGAIMPVMALTVMTLLTNQQQATDHNIVLQQVQNTGYWVSRDVQMAKDVTLNDPNGFPLTLDIPVDTDENNNLKIEYLFDDNKLKRQVYDSMETLISQTLISTYLNVTDTTFIVLNPDIYKLTVKASKGEVVVEASYEVCQMPN